MNYSRGDEGLVYVKCLNGELKLLEVFYETSDGADYNNILNDYKEINDDVGFLDENFKLYYKEFEDRYKIAILQNFETPNPILHRNNSIAFMKFRSPLVTVKEKYGNSMINRYTVCKRLCKHKLGKILCRDYEEVCDCVCKCREPMNENCVRYDVSLGNGLFMIKSARK